MSKTVAIFMGVVFILIGLCGFAFPNLLGAHLSLTHNLIHLISGAVSLYIGLKGSLSAAKWFCYGFGFLYLALGFVGYWLGYNHMETFLSDTHGGSGYNQDMFRMIPGILELGTIDHIIHFVIAAVYIIAAALTRTRRNAAEFFEGNPE